jgi:hypothetical protein
MQSKWTAWSTQLASLTELKAQLAQTIPWFAQTETQILASSDTQETSETL